VLELARRGHEVECACEGPNLDPRFAAAGIVVHNLSFPRQSSPLGFCSAVGRMRTLLRRRRYTCVNSHNRNASFVARIAAWLERVPINLYTAHGFYFHDGQARWLREATILLEALLARITHFTLSQSAEDVRLVVGRGLIPTDRIGHIGNGIDVARFSPQFDRRLIEDKLGLERVAFRIATTGRIVKGKGFEDLLQACALLSAQDRSYELLMIGGNIAQDVEPYEKEFRARTCALQLDGNVRITGMVGNVEDYLATADAFVLPSYREGMPRSLIEAMSMGLACVATDIRGCREIISDESTGFLYPVGNIGALADLLKRCMDNPAERAAVGARARAAAVREFAEDLYVRRQVSYIEHLLRRSEE